MDIVHMLQQSIGIGIGSGTGSGKDASAKDVGYCLTKDGLVIFKGKIYVLDNNKLKKVILREFHVKPYLGHLGYEKTFDYSEEILLLAEFEEGCSRVVV